MSYGSERHRRKVMREMRLAGYDLPGTPYQRKNRKFQYHNKKAGVSTAKVKTSQKTITGKRKIAYVKMNWNPNQQQRAMFAAIMAKKADGSYVPSTKADGTYTREDKKWNEWIAGGKKGPSPYDLKHPQMMQALGSSTSLKDEYEKTQKMKTLLLDDKNVMIVDVTGESTGNYDPSTDRRLIGTQFDPKTWSPARYEAAKKIAIMMYKLNHESIPPEDSAKFKRELLIVDNMGNYGSHHPKQVEETALVYKRLGLSDRESESIAQIDLRKKVIERMSNGVMLDDTGTALDVTKSKFVRIPDEGRFDSKLPFIRAPSKAERQAQKQLQRKESRERHLAEVNAREAERKQREQERTQRPAPAPNPVYVPTTPIGESPAARTRRLAREAEAKAEAKKAGKEHRYKKSYRRPPKRRKPSDDGWGDLIEAKPRKKSKHIKRKRIAGVDTIIATRRKRRSAPRKKAGFGDTFFSAAERGWKRIEAGRAKRKAYHETEEYKKAQEERAQRRAEGVREFKEQAKHVEHDVKEGYKREKKKWINEKVSGPGYNWAGHPIKGYKPPEKKPEKKKETIVAGSYNEDESSEE